MVPVTLFSFLSLGQVSAQTISNHYTSICLFVCLERALARIPTLRRPVEWYKPSYKELV